jgi:hypothetical protein
MTLQPLTTGNARSLLDNATGTGKKNAWQGLPMAYVEPDFLYHTKISYNYFFVYSWYLFCIIYFIIISADKIYSIAKYVRIKII